MKTLASCSPCEFLVQTNRIRKNAETWLNITKVMEIRKRVPSYSDDMSDEEKTKLAREQARKNINDMLESMMGENPQETAELLGLLCFIEPADLNNHSMIEFLPAVTELINNKEVVDFFISLMNLANLNISGT